MNQLIIAALKKRRVDRNDWLDPVAGHPSGQRDGVLLGNGDIKIPIRVRRGKINHAGALAHCGCDTCQS